MSVRCGGMRPTLGIGLPQLVGRHALADHGAALHQIVRQRREAFRLDERDAVLGQQVLQHLRVLPGDGGAEHGEHADRQAEIDRQAVDVAGAGAGAGAEDHLVAWQVGDDLVDHRTDRAAAAIHDALAADLHHVDPRQDGEVGRRLGGASGCAASLSEPLTSRWPSSVSSGVVGRLQHVSDSRRRGT